MKKRSNFLLYLVLNIIVSAATTLGVLVIWDNNRKSEVPPAPTQMVMAQQTGKQPSIPTQTPHPASLAAATPAPASTLPPAGQQVIQILSVVGVGDIQQEVVLIKRMGEGNILMTGWKLSGEHNNIYTFPAQPELILYKDGAVQIYSREGTDTATDVYWNRTDPAWRSGETIRLIDPQGTERASYIVP